MNIDRETLSHIAALSHLELPEGEREQLTLELEKLVTYMDILNELDTAGVEPLSHVFPVKNVLREDTAAPSLERAALLANAPATDGETFLVPQTVE